MMTPGNNLISSLVAIHSAFPFSPRHSFVFGRELAYSVANGRVSQKYTEKKCFFLEFPVRYRKFKCGP